MDVLPWLIFAAVAALIGGLSWLGRRSEHRDEAHPARVRMPRYVRAADGTRFGINPGTFDVSPLLKALNEQGWDLTNPQPARPR